MNMSNNSTSMSSMSNLDSMGMSNNLFGDFFAIIISVIAPSPGPISTIVRADEIVSTILLITPFSCKKCWPNDLRFGMVIWGQYTLV